MNGHQSAIVIAAIVAAIQNFKQLKYYAGTVYGEFKAVK